MRSMIKAIVAGAGGPDGRRHRAPAGSGGRASSSGGGRRSRRGIAAVGKDVGEVVGSAREGVSRWPDSPGPRSSPWVAVVIEFTHPEVVAGAPQPGGRQRARPWCMGTTRVFPAAQIAEITRPGQKHPGPPGAGP